MHSCECRLLLVLLVMGFGFRCREFAKGLIFYRCFYLFDAYSLRSLNESQPNLDTYSLMTAVWKFGPNSTGHLPPFPAHGLGQKRLFGTDFERWPNISIKRNMISTIGKKLVNLERLPYICPPKFRELWSRNGWERLVSSPKFSHWDTLPAFWFSTVCQISAPFLRSIAVAILPVLQPRAAMLTISSCENYCSVFSDPLCIESIRL